jgi:hypothetical protein
MPNPNPDHVEKITDMKIRLKKEKEKPINFSSESACLDNSQ